MLIIKLLVIFFIFVLVVNDTLLEIMFQKVPIDNITFLKLKCNVVSFIRFKAWLFCCWCCCVFVFKLSSMLLVFIRFKTWMFLSLVLCFRHGLPSLLNYSLLRRQSRTKKSTKFFFPKKSLKYILASVAQFLLLSLSHRHLHLHTHHTHSLTYTHAHQNH